MNNIRHLTAALVFAATLASCGSSDPSVDRAGSRADPVDLVLATADEESSPAGRLVATFAAEVDRLSGHRIIINPEYHVNHDKAAWDQLLLGSAQSGQYDLVLVPSRAWHEVGVRTLDLLQLPAVFIDDTQVDRLLQSDVPEKLLAGLQAADMVGLGLLPESMRFLTSLDGHPITSSGLRGAEIRVAKGDTLFAATEALGATPVDLSHGDFADAVYNRDVTITETSLDHLDTLPVAEAGVLPTLAINLPLYFKFQVLAATDSAVERLGSDRSILDAAAASTLEQVNALRVTTSAAFTAACSAGESISTIGAADLTAIHKAVAPLLDAAAAGPNGALLDELRKATGSPSEPTLTACPAPEPTSTVGESTSSPATTVVVPTTLPEPIFAPLGEYPMPTDRSEVVPAKGDLPNGVYRATFTAEQLDLAEPNVHHEPADGGAIEWTLQDGTLALQGYDPLGAKDGGAARGSYRVDGNHVVWLMPGAAGLPGTNGMYVFEWSLEGDTLHLRQVDGQLRDPWFVFPYEKVSAAG